MLLVCTRHKKDEARTMWEEKGYPRIDWSSLHTRLSSSYKHVEEVLDGKQGDFGDSVWQDIRAGKKRDLLTTSNYLPGYYGSKGSRVMLEHIVAHFSDFLKKKEASNEIRIIVFCLVRGKFNT